MTEVSTQLETHDIVVEELFPNAPEAIWKTLTTPELIGRWLNMKLAGFEPVKGARFTFQTRAAGAWDGVIHCEVLEVARNERLSYSWRGGDRSIKEQYGSLLDTVVTWTLTKVGSHTRLRLVHSGFVAPRNDSAFKHMGEGWKTIVVRINELSAEQYGSIAGVASKR